MKEQPDKARVVFGCSGCGAKADVESELLHEEKAHAKKVVRLCTRSGQGAHTVKPAKTTAVTSGLFSDLWHGFRVRKPDGFSILEQKLPQDNLLLMSDKTGQDRFMVQVDPKHAARTLEELTATCAAQLKSQVDVKEKADLDFRGAKGVRIVYETRTKPSRRVSTVYVRTGGDFLLFTCSDLEPFDDHAKQFTALLESVELLRK